MKDYEVELSAILREYVRKNEIVPAWLIEGAGLGCATVYAWFHGQSRPTLGTLLAIAEALGFKVEVKYRPPAKPPTRDGVQRRAAQVR